MRRPRPFWPHPPLLQLALCVAATAASCSDPCEQLKSNARSCGYAAAPYVDPERSVCSQTRDSHGEAFDNYAACLLQDQCVSAAKIDSCSSVHLAVEADTAGHGACTKLTLWAAACGLEPTAAANDCAASLDTLGPAGFDRWVVCITEEGCPKPADARFERCASDVVPDEAGALIDACTLVSAWTQQCAGRSPEPLPVNPIPFPVCLAEAAPFTSASYLEYATCLSELACDDIIYRLDCYLQLQILDRRGIDAQCQRLLDYDLACASALAGGDLDNCDRIYARFTRASFDDYIECVTTAACDAGVAATADCASWLLPQ